VKLTVAVRTGPGLGRGKIAAQAAHAAVVSALANLGTANFRVWPWTSSSRHDSTSDDARLA
jgi:peptidyl-tRNA hydrolase